MNEVNPPLEGATERKGYPMRFERSELSRLTSRRAKLERRIGKLTWRIANDPMANLVGLSTERDRLYEAAADVTLRIAAEQHADERRTLRKALLTAT